MPRSSLLLLCMIALAADARAQSAGFVVKVGADTIAVENYRYTDGALTGELNTRGMGDHKYHYDAATVAGDTLPFLNLSFATVEIATRRAAGRDSVRFHFRVTEGVVVPVVIRRIAPGRLAFGLGGVDIVLDVDEQGRIQHGAVPVQNVTIERSATPVALSSADYSAPPDAAYTAEAVTIPAGDGRVLAGTLTVPKSGSAPFPVAITISGSGLQERNGALAGISGYTPFLQFAEALAARGIAMLRYDDRGIGASTGNAAGATSADFADDARAVVSFLRRHQGIDARNVFLIGHSEGGLIAPMIAAADTALGGIVLLAAPAWTGRRILGYQMGATDAQLDSLGARQPWVRYFLDYDPLPTARRVRTPVLILQGATDRQVRAEQADELAAAFRANGNADVTVHVLPEIDHLFLKDASGQPAGYARLPDKAVAANVVALMIDWIVQHAK